MLLTATHSLPPPTANAPRVCIGLPVFNGEEYLTSALDSILAQTYSDFQLVISDNASTDRTGEICLEYAAKDPRVRYFRNEQNIGAMQNWYRTFQLAPSEYFFGAAHDDMFHPQFLERCVAALDANPAVVVAYTKSKIIDEHGNLVGNFDATTDTTSPKAHERLYHVIRDDLLCVQLLGVMRSSAFRMVTPFVGYYGCDRNVLAELALLGPIYEVPEYLFYHRLHAKALGAAKGSGRSLQQLLALDPGIDWKLRFPKSTVLRNYFLSVWRLSPSFADRILGTAQLVRLLAEKSLHRFMR